MKDDASSKLARALTQTTNSHTRARLAKITGIFPNGMVQAYSETMGNVRVLARTAEELQIGDSIYVSQVSVEKNAPWLYQGFAGAAGSTRTKPRVDGPIVTPVPNDTTPGGQYGTVQYTLDQIVAELRKMKGMGTWLEQPGQNLKEVRTFRAPVLSVLDLPETGNRLGDLRYVIVENRFYAWSSSGWVLPFAGESTGDTGQLVALTAATPVASYRLVMQGASGVTHASASNIAHMGRVVGLTIESASATLPVMVQFSGLVKTGGATFGLAPGPVVLGENGQLASAVLPGSRFAQPIGLLVSSSQLILRLGTEIQL